MPAPLHQSESLPEHALDSLLESYLHEPSAELAETLRRTCEQVCNAQRQSIPLHVLKNAVEQSPVAISITDLDANILYANHCFTEVTGYTQEEIVGHNESVLSYKSTPPEVYRELWETIQDERRWSGKLVNRRKNGSRYLAEVVISPVFNQSGEVTHFLGIHRDVTEMFALECQVTNQKALIESVVDSTPTIVAVLDQALTVLLDNQAYKKLITAMGEAEPAGVLLARLSENSPEFAANLVAQRSFQNHEVACDMATGETRWFSCSGIWFHEQQTDVDAFFSQQTMPYMLLLAHDITSQKQQQESIRSNAMRALLAEEGMYQSLHETLSGAVFQLESPFNMLNAAMDMLARRRDKSEMDETLLSVLSEVREQAGATLNNLQAAIPRELGLEPVSLNLNQLVHDVLLVSTDRLISEGIVIDWHPSSVLTPVFGEEIKIRNMFKHLLDNATDAIMESDRNQREIHIVTMNEDDWVRVTVSDSGDGIPESHRIKVFEPFFSTKPDGAQHHAGMGLTMAQDVVNRHGGTLEIDGNVHQGCRIHVRFPVPSHNKR